MERITTVKPVETIPCPLRVVALGGGTGLPEVLRGFKGILFPDGADDPGRLVAVVTVTDDGGSSGRLREELGMLPPGDIRNCLVALSHNEPLMARLFQTRYRGGDTLGGHPVGNLILVALAQEEAGGFLTAIHLASEVLNIQGQVYPSTLIPARLKAHLKDGRHVVGETALAAAGGAVSRLELDPPSPPATPGVVEAIERADIVVLGPGSLFTSIIPNLLVPEVAAALTRTKAFRILVINGMTEPGETAGFNEVDHLRAVLDHAGAPVLDAVLTASDVVSSGKLERYRTEGAERVAGDDQALAALVPIIVRRELFLDGPKVRHDPLRTAAGVLHGYLRFREGEAAPRVRRAMGNA